ncbi:MAG: small multi-drug export protein [Helicobacteraceae bacterium]|nr:small multi-drug export protein [Helicobacteraceae bacterium]
MKREDIKKAIFSQQGMILLLGVTLVALLGVFISLYYFIDPDFVHKVSAMVVTNVIVGRVPSLSLGYASGLSHFEVIVTNVYIEMIMVTFIYSAFIFSYHNILRVRFLEKFFSKSQEYREKYAYFFDKFGIVALFVFVFIPFWMTGPIVGAIIGYLIGLRHFTIIATVFIATLIAVSLWGLLLNELVELLNVMNNSLIWIALIFIILFTVAVKMRSKK